MCQLSDDAKLQREIVTVRLDNDIDYEGLLENKELKINMGISSIIGTRQYQQDTVFGHSDTNSTLAIVCDGMGGLTGGEKASQTATQLLAEDYFSRDKTVSIPEFFRQEAVKMDAAVYSLMDEDGNRLDAGTTCVATIIEGNKLYWLSVGDSKIYIIRNNEIMAVNREHNYRLRLDDRLKRGLISEEDYKAEEAQAEALISYIGIGNVTLMDINQSPFELMEDDVVLLCSDGLYKRLNDMEILELIKYEMPDVNRAAKRLTDVVIKKTTKAQDNTSLVLLQYSKY